MKLSQICVVYTFLSVLLLSSLKLSQACSNGCTCTTILVKDGEEPDLLSDGTDAEDESEGGMPLSQATRGRKVSCSNNPYPFTSIEEVRRAVTIPLDTIDL